MEAVIVVLMLTMVLAVGVLVYLWVTMRKQLIDAKTKIDQTTTAVADTTARETALNNQLITEAATRQATYSNIVGQVNNVNDLIHGAVSQNARDVQATSIYFNSGLSSNVTAINSNLSKIQQQQNSINSGLGKFMSFKQNADGSGPPVLLADLPGVANPDVQLIQHVTATMGMKVNDLHTDIMTINGDLNLQTNWKVQTQGDRLCFVHGMNTVACLSDATQKLQVYQNSDKNAPYLYYNSTGELGTNPGGAYEYTSDAAAAQTLISQSISDATTSNMQASQRASQAALQASNTAANALVAAQLATSNANVAITRLSAIAAPSLVTYPGAAGPQFTSFTFQGAAGPQFTSFTFTTMGTSGATGPTAVTYSIMPVGGLTLINGIQFWTVPQSGTYTIIAAGAGTKKWSTSFTGGRGIIVSTSVALIKGARIKILVGQQGTNATAYSGTGGYAGYGAGGGTFITTDTNSPLLIAGGGGNAYYVSGPGGDAVVTTAAAGGSGPGALGGTNGSGGSNNQTENDANEGAGYIGNAVGTSINAARSYTNGGRGGIDTPSGGFGGGGTIGGGGGYSGGGGIDYGRQGWGGGGGSYDVNGGVSNTATQYTATINGTTGGYNTEQGFVVISLKTA
jgi:hypothetical protein